MGPAQHIISPLDNYDWNFHLLQTVNGTTYWYNASIALLMRVGGDTSYIWSSGLLSRERGSSESILHNCNRLSIPWLIINCPWHRILPNRIISNPGSDTLPHSLSISLHLLVAFQMRKIFQTFDNKKTTSRCRSQDVTICSTSIFPILVRCDLTPCHPA